MELSKKLRNNDRLTRTLLAVGLAVFALWSLRRGKRFRGVLAGLGAVTLGYSASTESSDVVEELAEELDIGLTTEDEQMRCAICGDPIVTGQSRTPNENDEIIHGACLETPA